jgi:predicted NAD-dependent protein-ADP-ribosyltransferase YbiA (DUF1768 family)
VSIIKDGIHFNSIHQCYAYVYAKFHKRNDLLREIRSLNDSKLITKLIKDVKVTSEWFECNIGEMISLLQLKAQNCVKFTSSLRALAGKTIVYANKWDGYWGSGIDNRVSALLSPKKYPGQNRLGILLMQLCEELNS